MAKMDFGGVKETVVTRGEFPLKKAKQVLKKEKIAVIGYGVQGPAQSLNMRDNGVDVIIGQRPEEKDYWDKAVKDGWKPGKTLLPIAEAVEQATIVQFLISDAGQMAVWPKIKRLFHPGDALYFSHGFAITYSDKTKVIPPDDIDVILVAPKGSGTSVRRNFLDGSGINSSYAVWQDATGRAEERCLALGIAVGSGFLFPTSFEKEVYSDLVGERGVLMGALAGVMEAQYNELRRRGHEPSEAFNETVEELTQSLIRLVGENGMDWMFANCSATAQRGALDWAPRFRKAVAPLFRELYAKVKSGEEAARVLRVNSRKDVRERLARELGKIHDSEMWRAGETVRSLRPEKAAKPRAATRKGARKTAAKRGRKTSAGK
jgi:ketol-acid reductoisomerase